MLDACGLLVFVFRGMCVNTPVCQPLLQLQIGQGQIFASPSPPVDLKMQHTWSCKIETPKYLQPNQKRKQKNEGLSILKKKNHFSLFLTVLSLYALLYVIYFVHCWSDKKFSKHPHGLSKQLETDVTETLSVSH